MTHQPDLTPALAQLMRLAEITDELRMPTARAMILEEVNALDDRAPWRFMIELHTSLARAGLFVRAVHTNYSYSHGETDTDRRRMTIEAATEAAVLATISAAYLNGTLGLQIQGRAIVGTTRIVLASLAALEPESTSHEWDPVVTRRALHEAMRAAADLTTATWEI